MPRFKRCNQCGVARNLTLTANVHDAESGIGMGLKRLCFPCLMGVFNIPLWEIKKLSVYSNLMASQEKIIK